MKHGVLVPGTSTLQTRQLRVHLIWMNFVLIVLTSEVQSTKSSMGLRASPPAALKIMFLRKGLSEMSRGGRKKPAPVGPDSSDLAPEGRRS